MENSKYLDLKVTTNSSFETDDIKDTIVSYGENFKALEENISKSYENTEQLETGKRYDLSQKIWNSSPVQNGYAGWINVREGLHAPAYQTSKTYDVEELIRASPDNGKIYECIVSGKTSKSKPSFLTSDGVEFYDVSGNDWDKHHNYQVDDIVLSTDGSKIFYYVCETAGLSSDSEPLWNLTPNGSTLIDGSVVWRKEKNITWKQVDNSCNFRQFGKIE